jgi:hypothetical protein
MLKNNRRLRLIRRVSGVRRKYVGWARFPLLCASQGRTEQPIDGRYNPTPVQEQID